MGERWGKESAIKKKNMHFCVCEVFNRNAIQTYQEADCKFQSWLKGKTTKLTLIKLARC
jgi:hypothetical protein